MIGTQVGSWFIRKLLGEGGMGRVYLAEHVHLKDLWAVKMLADELTQRPDVVARFLAEARAAAHVRHRNLIRVAHIDQQPNGAWYMVMEYLQGQTLAQHLAAQQHPASYGLTLRIAGQVASALHALHKHGIVHRDVKPENVFLVERDNDDKLPILLDLGVALVGEALGGGRTLQGTVIGTPNYMAPEQLLGQPVTAAADVYALGVLIYEMSTGGWMPYQQDGESRTAYYRLSPAEIYRRHTSEAIVDPRRRHPMLNDAWVRGMHAMLARDPATRVASAKLALLELARAMPPDGATQDGLKIIREYARDLLVADTALEVTLRASPEARHALVDKHGSPGLSTSLLSVSLPREAPSRRRTLLAGATAALLAATAVVAIAWSRREPAERDGVATPTAQPAAPHAAPRVESHVAPPRVEPPPRPEPRVEPPPRPEPRVEPPPRTEPRVEPPPRAEPPYTEPPRAEPPAKSETPAQPVVAKRTPAIAKRTPPSTAKPAVERTPATTSAGENGTLVVVASPWAAVFLNNTNAGVTPFRKALPPGKYVVKLVNDDLGKSHVLTITIESKKTSNIEERW